jgi:uncharacterized protein YcgI (DUF1989 family)
MFCLGGTSPRRLPLVWPMLPPGSALRLTDCQGGANLSVVLYNAEQKLERYNMPDSLKAQHTATTRAGHVLMSDMGRAMASITADSLGWHDPWAAARRPAHARQVRRNQLPAPPQRHVPLGRDGLLIEIGKYGLTRATWWRR